MNTTTHAHQATRLQATKKKKGEFLGLGAAVQALGLASFFIRDVGWILGVILLIIGARLAIKTICSNCGNHTTKDSKICAACGAHFS
jgi:hypothetical protein